MSTSSSANGGKRNKGKSLAAPKVNKHGKWEVTDMKNAKAMRGELNVSYCSDDFRKSAKQAWHSTEDCREISLEKGAVVHKYPFSCCVLPDFVGNVQFLYELKEELLSLDFNEKNNDLYKFQQSEDLKSKKNQAVNALKTFIYEDFRTWLIDVTGIELNTKVDMSSAQYSQTDILLCHDDELEGRRIAYILYLVDEDWNETDGGSLELFTVDEHNQPSKVVKSLPPKWNSVAFFEVTPFSFHQVSEVLSENKCRLSVVGWFHGTPVKRLKPYIEPVHILKPVDLEEEEFYSWINPAYLDPSTQGDVQESFEEKSEIQLQEFINPEKYQALCEALRSPDITWTNLGPANKRNYEICAEEDTKAISILKEVRAFFQSEALFLVLSSLTGLKLHKLAPTPSSSENESDDDGKADSKRQKKIAKTIDPCCKFQVSRWKSGCYTLLHDQDPDSSEYALDVWLFVGADNWQLSHGGQISYIARGEDEELLTVCPSNNCLALVYRDNETLRFVKHINSSSGDLEHYMLNGVYYDQPLHIKVTA